LEILNFVYENLLKLYKEDKLNTIFINLMGKTEDEIYEELKTKLLALEEKEAK